MTLLGLTDHMLKILKQKREEGAELPTVNRTRTFKADKSRQVHPHILISVVIPQSVFVRQRALVVVIVVVGLPAYSL